jgi:hypothetical protein
MIIPEDEALDMSMIDRKKMVANDISSNLNLSINRELMVIQK